MISKPLNEIEQVAERWTTVWGGSVVDGQSTVGGGSLPGEVLPTRLAALKVTSPSKFLARLRGGAGSKPIIARVEADLVVFDPRTVGEMEMTDV